MKQYLFYIAHNYAFEILRPLQAEILRQGDQVAWFVEGDEINFNYFYENEHVIRSVADVLTYAPYATFVPGNMIPSFFPGFKVCIFHGFVGFKTRVKDNINYHFIIRDCFDLYCTHGQSSTSQFKELERKHQYFKVLETGYCKMDPYFDGTYPARVKNNKPVILFSSTFSPRLTQAPVLLKTIERLSKNPKWKWKVTFHPKMDIDTVNAYKAIQHENLEFIETDKLAPHMIEADLMVGDNSSMITDYLLLEKPVVTFNNEAPKGYLHNILHADQLDDAITYALGRPDKLMQAIHRFVQDTHPYQDGQSSRRVLSAVSDLAENFHRLRKKPLNIIRNIKMRKKLGYWNF
ncbi:MAG: CDP-glycerol glycerophosphotransferase (TagB/SpsB family) [Paraglaciecola sp.]